jgi:hypothetical protein
LESDGMVMIEECGAAGKKGSMIHQKDMMLSNMS